MFGFIKLKKNEFVVVKCCLFEIVEYMYLGWFLYFFEKNFFKDS